MGRKQTIDRDALLDATERVVLRDGAGQLTLEAVAAEAGVSKGGILYAYSTKDQLIDALFARAFADFGEAMEAIRGTLGDAPEDHARAHVVACRATGAPTLARIVALLTNVMRLPDHRRRAAQYYDDLFARLDLATPFGRRARLAVLACEGAFMLRGFDLASLDDPAWQAIHDDVVEFLLPLDR